MFDTDGNQIVDKKEFLVVSIELFQVKRKILNLQAIVKGKEILQIICKLRSQLTTADRSLCVVVCQTLFNINLMHCFFTII